MPLALGRPLLRGGETPQSGQVMVPISPLGALSHRAAHHTQSCRMLSL